VQQAIDEHGRKTAWRDKELNRKIMMTDRLDRCEIHLLGDHVCSEIYIPIAV
jgi:hypothetical protein